MLWQNFFGGSNDDYAYKIFETDNDNGFIVAGYSYSIDGDVLGNVSTSGNEDVWLIKLDSLGSLIWSKCYGGYGTDFCLAATKGLPFQLETCAVNKILF